MTRARSILLIAAVTTLASVGPVEASPVVQPPSLWMSTPEGAEPERLVKFTDIGAEEPAWSPDSTRITYIDPWLSIVDLSSGNTERITPDPAYSPDWSPDGTSIAFARVADRNVHGIYVINLETEEIRRLTTGRDDYPDWSPDGTEIVYTRRGTRQGVFVVDVASGDKRKLVGDLAREARWSPDGSWIGYVGWPNVYVVRPDGTGVTNLSRIHDNPFLGSFSWSPDSTQVAYSREKLFVIDVPSGRRTRLRPKVGSTDNPVWSPDGKRILFDNFDYVFSIRPDGSGRRRITMGRVAAWAPGGSRIAFLRHDN